MLSVSGMLVYGQPEFQDTLSSLLAQLRLGAARARPASLDDLRRVLVQMGQMEQGLEDSSFARQGADAARVLKQFCRATDCAAAAFFSEWTRQCAPWVSPAWEPQELLRELGHLLGNFEPAADPLLTVRVPEGFKFYALFPEQYCVAALKWAAAHAGAARKCARVVGIRSIGTSLSALVLTVLKALGWDAQRCTVRPEGHPFDRHVNLGPAGSFETIHALVVDEGPGLSGSSMAAVAAALAKAGASDISFLPGHGGEPGSAAPPAVRRWWAETPRYWVTLEDLRWNGRSLPELLAERTETIARRQVAASKPRPQNGGRFVEDLSAGAWRRHVFSSEQDWPAAAARFERTKFRCRASRGGALLWKFHGFGGLRAGLATDRTPASGRVNDGTLARTAAKLETFVPPLLESFGGFLAFPWIEGTPLAPAAAHSETVSSHLGLYLLASARAGLDPSEARRSIGRLQAMIACNLQEAFGQAIAERGHSWAESIQPRESQLSYGDGRLAPYEWIRTPEGKIFKTDYLGHDSDHTLVGPQSLLWDLAGLFVEWKLDRHCAGAVLRPLREAGVAPDRQELLFYQLAYASFRMGLCALCAESATDPAEHRRLGCAKSGYRSAVETLLKAGPGLQATGAGSFAELARPNH